MIALIRPVLMSFLNSDKVKRLIVDMLRKLAEQSDNTVDDQAVDFIERGDLLMSAGDGTAKPQDDDIIRSKTVAKVTSTNVSCTYDDGSYCVPCVLMGT